MPFTALGLSESLVRAIAEQGYESPTPIQEKAIPVVLSGKDLIATAQTGTGKTASFVLPIIERLAGRKLRGKRIRALVLVPTRELAVQVAENISRYAKYSNISYLAMYGGSEIALHKRQLIDGVDIVVATPGRLLDMAHQRALHFDELECLVLDEADRMLDMGFIGDINKIIERLPEERQNLLFSATISPQVKQLVKTTIHHAVEILLAGSDVNKPDISQWLVTVDKDKKSALLSHLIQTHQWQQALIFIRTKHGAVKLVEQLAKRGIVADYIHGDRSQVVRMQILDDFKSGKCGLLVATGVAARGLDIDDLDRVVNYDLPNEIDEYIHRIGRTGRAGAKGEAVSLVSKDDFKTLCSIESRLGHIIERRDLEEFAPRKVVPISILNYVPKSKRT
ncbi:DEAD/DEAH box helicase [Gilvimarinus agarilyticus]|uniref:DEAD/DEAH box helicase n=1 Tax=unclassified Gilvimarinus TaxID=2642066 RepID=UPI001C085FC2|nr:MULTISPECIES: DEAD/DEAH box helicase [unclassified Gilvimarinus]MBU2885147.1 DEAD/DEAH box helicase [Gilvimarinus agarilyticus]MDO6570045.1 DEAD/DEAH box helicase [Gilvimarinus sp. 2_MG-2023]MDO6747312.1 DEAD/DEAH box helicase [Gilvimarinus sp. 1_MG-2023]